MLSKEAAWFVFYTLSKHENKVCQLLQKKKYDAYLPTQKVIRQWSDRKKKVVVPLFTNYVFVKTLPAELYYILRTAGVIKVLTENQRPVPIPEDEMDRIRLIMRGDTEIEVDCYEKELTPGSFVKISEGPFAGLEGRLLKNKGSCRLLVELKTLHKILKVEISADNLKKIYELEC